MLIKTASIVPQEPGALRCAQKRAASRKMQPSICHAVAACYEFVELVVVELVVPVPDVPEPDVLLELLELSVELESELVPEFEELFELEESEDVPEFELEEFDVPEFELEEPELEEPELFDVELDVPVPDVPLFDEELVPEALPSFASVLEVPELVPEALPSFASVLEVPEFVDEGVPVPEFEVLEDDVAFLSEDVVSVFLSSVFWSSAFVSSALSLCWAGAANVVFVPRPFPAVATLITAAPIATAATAAMEVTAIAMRFWRLRWESAAASMESEAMRWPSGPIS
jgi:hypothetical protein